MKNYESAAIVELGAAEELVLGLQSTDDDNPIDNSERNETAYESASIVDLGAAEKLVLGLEDPNTDNPVSDGEHA